MHYIHSESKEKGHLYTNGRGGREKLDVIETGRLYHNAKRSSP